MDRPPDFVVDESGFDDILGRLDRRRRRRRALTGAVSGTAIAAAVVAIAVTSTTGTDTLEVPPAGPLPTSSFTGSPVPSASPSAGGSTAIPSPTTTVVGGGPVQPIETPPPAPLSGTPRPHPTLPTAAGSGPVISTAMRRSRTSYDADTVCTDTSGRPAGGWCMDLMGDGHPTGRGGHPTPLAIELCRLPGVEGDAHFPGTLEADLSLERQDGSGDEPWHYAAQHPDRAFSHHYVVDGGTCLVWRTTWRVTDDAGTPLEPGHYTLLVSVNADNVSAPNGALVKGYDFTVE